MCLTLGLGMEHGLNDVADRYPHVWARGVDLYPPRQEWVPSNCTLEIDDIPKDDWATNTKYDLIHCRQLLGTFSIDEWDRLYKCNHDNLKPGG